MIRLHKVVMVVLAVALLFAAVPLVSAQDQPPPPQPPQPQPPQPANPDVNVNVDLPWGTILVVALVLGLIVLLAGAMGGTSTHTIERVDEHHHHVP